MAPLQSFLSSVWPPFLSPLLESKMVPSLHQTPGLQGQRARGLPRPPPNSDLLERPFRRGDCGWTLPGEARGTGLGPDNPRSKQPVSGLS